jgi:hypothetical protein
MTLEIANGGWKTKPHYWKVDITSNSKDRTSRLVRVEAERMNVVLDSLPPHCDLDILVCGVSEDSSRVGVPTLISQSLLPQLSLTQTRICERELNFRWNFGAWSSPGETGITSFELELLDDDYVVQQKSRLLVGQQEITALGGFISILSPPSLRRNRTHKARMRCYSKLYDLWGAWSPTFQLFTLTDVSIDICSINEESVTIIWGRYRASLETGQQTEWPDTAIDSRLLEISRFEVFLWKAAEKESTAAPSTGVTYQSIPQLHITKPNRSLIRNLQPETVYNTKIVFSNSCGGDPETRFFRFRTSTKPRVTQIPCIAPTYFQIRWSLNTVAARPFEKDLLRYSDDDLGSKGETLPQSTHLEPNKYTLILSDEAYQVPQLHQVEVVTSDEQKKSVEVTHDPSKKHQEAQVNGLKPGTPYTVRIRSAGAAFSDVASGIGVEQSSWGSWTNSFVITTLNDVMVRVEQRGSNFFEISWRSVSVPPVMVIDSSFRGFIDSSMAEFASYLENPAVTLIEPSELLIGIGKCEDEVTTNSNPLAGDGDPDWAISTPEGPTFRRIKYSVLGSTKFLELKPDASYRLSHNLMDMKGSWRGRKSVIIRTLPDDVLTTASVSKGVRVDVDFHLKHQELPRFGASDEGRMLYQVKIAADRESELRAIAFQSPTRVGNVALVSEVDTLGHDHAVIHWRAYHVVSNGDTALVSLKGDDPPPDSIQLTLADRINRSTALIEYRMKVFWERLSGNGSEDSGGVTDLYFRSCTRRTKLLGLKPEYRYKCALSMLSATDQQWTPWSDFLQFEPISCLLMQIKHVTPGGVQLHWARREHAKANSADQVHPTVIQQVAIEVSVPRLGVSKSFLQAPCSGYLLKDLPTSVSSVVVQPEFAFNSWGPKSAPLHVAVEDVRLTLKAVGRRVIVVEWVPLVSTSCENKLAQKSERKILLSIKSKDWSSVADVPYDSASYTFENLSDSTQYIISGKGIKETALCDCCHRGVEFYEASECPQLAVSTLGPAMITVEHVGEKFVTVRWRRTRRVAQVESDSPMDSDEASLIGGLSGALRRTGSKHSSDAPTIARLRAALPIQALDDDSRTGSGTPRTGAGSTLVASTQNRLNNAEAYILIVRDVEFGEIREERVTPSLSYKGGHMTRRVTGLKADGLYEFTVKPVLTSDGLLDFGTVSERIRTLGKLLINFEFQASKTVIRFERKRRIPRITAAESVGVPAYKRMLTWKTDLKETAVEPEESVEFRNLIEVRIDEIPRAPLCVTSSVRKKLASVVSEAERPKSKLFSKRTTLSSSGTKIELDNLPQGTSFKVTARQKSHEDCWSDWVNVTLTTPTCTM